MNKGRRKELASLKRDSKRAAAAALKQLTALRKEADKIIRLHQKADAAHARRIAILEGRLG